MNDRRRLATYVDGILLHIDEHWMCNTLAWNSLCLPKLEPKITRIAGIQEKKKTRNRTTKEKQRECRLQDRVRRVRVH